MQPPHSQIYQEVGSLSWIKDEKQDRSGKGQNLRRDSLGKLSRCLGGLDGVLPPLLQVWSQWASMGTSGGVSGFSEVGRDCLVPKSERDPSCPCFCSEAGEERLRMFKRTLWDKH